MTSERVNGLATPSPTRAGRSIDTVACATPRINALTVDVEDYFQVSAMAPYVERRSWDDRECRVEANVRRLLTMFASASARATFFTLGWVAQRYPALIRDIVAHGHELASHGHGHQRATEQTPTQFADDVSRAKAVLEDVSGRAVYGYRAPSFSIGASNPWAFDVLLEAGYRYSSSVYPVRHDHYGTPDAPRFAFPSRPGLLEIPVSTVQIWGTNLPAGGGGYFRLAPYALSRWALRRINSVDQQPAIFYFHPWEIDPEQPRIVGAGVATRFRHYVNLARTEGRLRSLLGDFRWGRVDDVFGLRSA